MIRYINTIRQKYEHLVWTLNVNLLIIDHVFKLYI